MLKTDFEIEPEGMTVPYTPLCDDIRRNHGFVDLRGRPDLVSKIPEGLDSTALQELLVGLSQPIAPFFTLGCDLGAHEEPDAEDGAHYVSGGYVQLMTADCRERSPDDYLLIGQTIEELLKPIGLEHRWIVRFVLTMVAFGLDGGGNLVPSLWIWFYAAGRVQDEALASREILIRGLHEALLNAQVTGCLTAR